MRLALVVRTEAIPIVSCEDDAALGYWAVSAYSRAVNLENLPALSFFILVPVIIGLGLWYLALRLGRRALKRWSLAVGILPFLVIAMRVLQDWSEAQPPPPFRTSVPGPAGRTGWAIREIPFNVAEGGMTHRVTLLARSSPEAPPAKPVSLGFSIRSATGEEIAAETRDLQPDRDLRWKPAKALIQPGHPGEYLIRVNVPGPVDVLDVEVAEVRQ